VAALVTTSPHRPPHRIQLAAVLGTALSDDQDSLVQGFRRNGIVARCACPDGLTIRIRGGDAASSLDARPVRCEICGQRFAPVAPGR